MTNYDIFKELNNINSICIIGHLDPDADALSSMVALKNFLQSKTNAEIDLFAECDEVVSNCKHIIRNQPFNKTPKEKYDLAIAVDSTNFDRLGTYENLFRNVATNIVIDHHSTNPGYGATNILEDTSSTCEIIYKILKQHHYQFTTEDYELLYSGILTDTSNFTNPSTNSQTHYIAGEICEHINISKIYNKFFSNFSLKNMTLFANAINNIKSYKNNKIILTFLPQKDLDLLGATNNDLTGIVNRLTQIENNILTCFIQPKGNNLNYISLRAKYGYDVGKLAKKFGGGGHVGASGFVSTKPQQEIIKEITDEFIKLLNTK